MDRRSQFLRAVFWAATWGVGTGLGVALGGWLTVTSGAGAPGVESLDTRQDLVVIPLAVGSIVVGLHLAGQVVVRLFGGVRAAGKTHDDDQNREHAKDEGIER